MVIILIIVCIKCMTYLRKEFQQLLKLAIQEVEKRVGNEEFVLRLYFKLSRRM